MTILHEAKKLIKEAGDRITVKEFSDLVNRKLVYKGIYGTKAFTYNFYNKKIEVKANNVVLADSKENLEVSLRDFISITKEDKQCFIITFDDKKFLTIYLNN